jgi:hypothetical protein
MLMDLCLQVVLRAQATDATQSQRAAAHSNHTGNPDLADKQWFVPTASLDRLLINMELKTF